MNETIFLHWLFRIWSAAICLPSGQEPTLTILHTIPTVIVDTNLIASTSPPLYWFIQHHGDKFRSEPVGEPKCHHRAWHLPILNVEMVEDDVLWRWKDPCRVPTCWTTQQGVLQMLWNNRWVPCLIFTPGVSIIVAWIRWPWNFKSYNSCFTVIFTIGVHVEEGNELAAGCWCKPTIGGNLKHLNTWSNNEYTDADRLQGLRIFNVLLTTFPVWPSTLQIESQ